MAENRIFGKGVAPDCVDAVYKVNMFVVILTAILLVCAFWLLNRDLINKSERRAVERLVLSNGDTELRLDDGSFYRTEIGYVWHRFPSGERADVFFERWLQKENDRLKLVDKWSDS